MSSTKKTPGLTGSTLKTIAIITMLIDHIGVALLKQGLLPLIYSSVLAGESAAFLPKDYIFWQNVYTALRFVGRLAFPIFCFLLVEGFLHTSSVVKYALRLGVFALLSELPFNLAFSGQLFNPFMQNVFLTLLLGLLVMMCMEYNTEHFFTTSQSKLPGYLINILIVMVGMVLAELLKTDYSGFGVLIIALLYCFRKNRLRQCIVGALDFSWEITAPLSFLLIYFYNGERGHTRLKYFFYLFYPLHLLLLFVLRLILI